MSFDGHLIIYHHRKILEPEPLIESLFALLEVTTCEMVLIIADAGNYHSETVLCSFDNLDLPTVTTHIRQAWKPWLCLVLYWSRHEPAWRSRIIEEIRAAMPQAIMDNWIPEMGGISIKLGPYLYDNILERSYGVASSYGYIRTEFSFEITTEVGCPSDWELARWIIFGQPTWIELKRRIEALTGPCHEYAFWFG